MHGDFPKCLPRWELPGDHRKKSLGLGEMGGDRGLIKLLAPSEMGSFAFMMLNLQLRGSHGWAGLYSSCV